MKALFTLLLLIICTTLSMSQTVTIDHKTQRFLGSVSELDRQRYFNLHSSSNDVQVLQFMEDYNVTPGRGFWGPFSYAANQTGAVGNYPAYNNNGNTDLRNVSRYIGTEHPRNVARWSVDKTVAANWAVEYFKDFANDDSRPEYFEPMNEPFVHAGDAEFSAEQPDAAAMRYRMAEWFGEIGQKIHAAPELDNMKVIGYSSAWPSMELWDFNHWETRMKMFMDVAGEHMDAFAVHPYDGVNITGQNNKRSGSNSEAILDLVEAYSHIKWGVVKEHAISEYGGITEGFGPTYTDLESIQSIVSINHLLFNFLEREDKMAISIPFITDKSSWHINASSNYQPYIPALFKPSNLGQPNPTGWTFSPRVSFYELWKDVKGKRTVISTDNPDIQAQAFADGNILYVALNNLDDANQTVNMDFTKGLTGLQNVNIKALKIYPDVPYQYTDNTQASAPATVDLIAGETQILTYTFASNILFDNALRSQKYYTSNYLESIYANSAINFAFNGVTTSLSGKATLRMSIGRKHDVSKSPQVTINGTTVTVPTNWKGYDQTNRSDFFGVIEIPIPYQLLQNNNNISVTFPDAGGRIASMILQVENYDFVVADAISLDNAPTTVISQTSYTVDVNYSALEDRDIVVEFWSPNGWLGAATSTVSSGSGIASLTINLPSAPAKGPGYLWKASIRPVGADWTQNFDIDQVNDVTVISPYSDEVMLDNAPLVVPSQTDYIVEVNYSASQDRDLILEFWSSTGWLGEGRITVAEGMGDTTVTVSLAAAPSSGTGYIWKSSIRPVAADWTQNLDTDQVNDVTVLSPYSDEVMLDNAPLIVPSQTDYIVEVNYSASQDRDLILEFWSSTGWLGEGRITVAEGMGDTTVTVSLATAPSSGTGYIWKSSIRPVAADWMENLATDQVNNITVLSPDEISLGNPPTYIPAKTAYTIDVNYYASQDRDMVIEFWSPSGWLGDARVTVAAGVGNAAIVINLATVPTPGTDFSWKASIRPVSTDWTQNLAADQENMVTVLANRKLFLSGNYTGNGTMHDALRSNGLLPLEQPFNSIPWNYEGEESTTQAVLNATSAAVVDWVLVELRDKNDNTTVVLRKAALLKQNGQVVEVDGVSPLRFAVATDDYYVTIMHRNHIGVMSATTTRVGASGNEGFLNTVDWNTTFMRDLGDGEYALWDGDINADGGCDASDRSSAWNNRNTSGYLTSDVNMDGVCDASDRSITWNRRNIAGNIP